MRGFVLTHKKDDKITEAIKTILKKSKNKQTSTQGKDKRRKDQTLKNMCTQKWEVNTPLPIG